MNPISNATNFNPFAIRLLTLLCVFGAIVLAGCDAHPSAHRLQSDGWHWTTNDPSIRPIRSADERVENGDAFDKAVFDIDRGATLVVPDDAEVERAEHAGRVEI